MDWLKRVLGDIKEAKEEAFERWWNNHMRLCGDTNLKECYREAFEVGFVVGKLSTMPAKR